MKEQALSLVQGMDDPDQALNRLREYLQALALRSLHESEAFRPLAFVGGTALRFSMGCRDSRRTWISRWFPRMAMRKRMDGQGKT